MCNLYWLCLYTNKINPWPPNSCWNKVLGTELGNVEKRKMCNVMTGISIQILKFQAQSPSTLFFIYGLKKPNYWSEQVLPNSGQNPKYSNFQISTPSSDQYLTMCDGAATDGHRNPQHTQQLHYHGHSVTWKILLLIFSFTVITSGRMEHRQNSEQNKYEGCCKGRQQVWQRIKKLALALCRCPTLLGRSDVYQWQ